jgi:hypothetical protein
MPNCSSGVFQTVAGWMHALFLVVGAAGVLSANALHAAGWTARAWPEYDRLFQPTNGWIGADGDYTVKLPNGRTLWLFSDTLVGEVQHNRRERATMIHNSAALQQGSAPAGAEVSFFYRRTPDGKPAALISPADGRGWFWLFDGAMADGKLFLFLVQIESKNSQAVFGFHQCGNWLAVVTNPLAPPTDWQVAQRKIPFAEFGREASLSFGAATLVTNGYVYIYGTRDRKKLPRTMVLARAPQSAPDDFASWEFRTRTGWSTNAAAAADLCAGLASEFSVSWLPARRRFVLVYTANGLSEKILVRTAPQPWGDWSGPETVFHCPETGWDRNNFCYAAKAHPLLAREPDELIVTYAANAYEFSRLFHDTRLYWPRFVRLKWGGPAPSTSGPQK